jgi:hypothetical protein
MVKLHGHIGVLQLHVELTLASGCNGSALEQVHTRTAHHTLLRLK